MAIEKQGELEVTRYTTHEERQKIARIEIEPEDVDHFVELLRNGLVEAIASHEAAVQDNFGLSLQTSIRLSRPVQDDDGNVQDLEGTHKLETRIRARKVYHENE